MRLFFHKRGICSGPREQGGGHLVGGKPLPEQGLIQPPELGPRADGAVRPSGDRPFQHRGFVDLVEDHRQSPARDRRIDAERVQLLARAMPAAKLDLHRPACVSDRDPRVVKEPGASQPGQGALYLVRGKLAPEQALAKLGRREFAAGEEPQGHVMAAAVPTRGQW